MYIILYNIFNYSLHNILQIIIYRYNEKLDEI